MRNWYYAVYRKKDGKLVACGSALACMVQLGFSSIHVFYTLVYRAKRGISKKYEVYPFCIDKNKSNNV